MRILTNTTVKPPNNNPNAWRYERGTLMTINDNGERLSTPGWAHFNLCGCVTGFTPDGMELAPLEWHYKTTQEAMNALHTTTPD